MRGAHIYRSADRRFGLHITPDLEVVIVAVIDTAGHPLDAGPLAALDRAEVQRVRDDLSAWLGEALDEHPVWSRLTDAQREDARELEPAEDVSDHRHPRGHSERVPRPLAFPKRASDSGHALSLPESGEVWEEIVTPALQDAQDALRDATRVLIAAQDHRDAVSAFVRDATFAAARMPGHDDAYGCCTHGPSVGRVCGCRTRGPA